MTNNKIKIDLSEIENLQDPYYEVEVKINKDTKIVFPSAFVKGEYSKEYYYEEVHDSNSRGVLLLKKRNGILKAIYGKFSFYPQVVDGVLYKEIREAKDNA